MESKPMTLLVIEDNKEECNNFIKCANSRNDISIVAITNSDIDGLKYIRSKQPEGIILDLELNSGHGNGSGLDFLINLNNMKLRNSPIVIVTTNVNSDHTYKFLHKNNVAMVLYKGQPRYSAEYVINTILLLRDTHHSESLPNIGYGIDNQEDKISELVSNELNLIGIGPQLKGRKYLQDAICYIVQNGDNNPNLIPHLINIHKLSSSAISQGMQNSINHAWRKTSIDDLLAHYKAVTNHETGVPTPMEFVYYYANKIKKLL